MKQEDTNFLIGNERFFLIENVEKILASLAALVKTPWSNK